MNHGERDVEQHIGIQGLHLSAFGIIFRKEKKAWNKIKMFDMCIHKYRWYHIAMKKEHIKFPVSPLCFIDHVWQLMYFTNRSTYGIKDYGTSLD